MASSFPLPEASSRWRNTAGSGLIGRLPFHPLLLIMTRTKKVRWGILATGRIAGIFAEGVQASRTGQLEAVGSRSLDAARAFARKHGVAHSHGSYEGLLANAKVDAVYIATPHPLHAQWAIRAAEAGKHVLCEKPAGLNQAEAMAMIEAAQRHGVLFMEAFMYRCHPQTRHLADLIAVGRIGELRLIRATFGFDSSLNLQSRIFSQALGGGGILDVGCYPVSMARLLAGAGSHLPFAEPLEVSGAAHLGTESRVDEWAAATLRFKGDVIAQLSTSIRLQQDNIVQAFGSTGHLTVPNPWMPGRTGEPGKILLFSKNQSSPEEILIPSGRPLYALEVDAFAAGIASRSALWPAMSPEDTLGNMRTLDRWREAIGLSYDSERAEAMNRNTVAARPLKRRPAGTRMTYGELPGGGKRVARLVLGADNQTTCPHASVMFDDYFERGGNCFDTAHVYRGGRCESVLGAWMRARSIREEVVLIGKGAHTPNCYPKAVHAQLSESLDRLQTSHVDLYMLHRDNPDVPVAEFVDALHEEQQRGRIRAYGVSNWTTERVESANRYAEKAGLPPLACVSNQFSLARMLDAPWPGCVSANTPSSRAWFEQTQMPLLAWSSQAQGFFTGRVGRGENPTSTFNRCWNCDDNYRRLERVALLSKRRKVDPSAAALAWVLQQPFPTFALIGCRTPFETGSSMQALTLDLSPEELAWLDLRTDQLP
jgi:predicted dehydrogenase/aryl-alcohol dehydrogenase-like predicted oxidoreductase